jgi:hypothetical protein
VPAAHGRQPATLSMPPTLEYVPTSHSEHAARPGAAAYAPAAQALHAVLDSPSANLPTGHGVHAAFSSPAPPALPYLPEGQAVQDVPSLEKKLVAQGEHCAVPGCGAMYPGAQGRHAKALEAPGAAEKRPAAHMMQPADVAPSDGLYEPARQEAQALLAAAPVASLYRPSGHSVQFVLAGAPAYVPAGHLEHRRLPTRALKLPAAQGAQPTSSAEAPFMMPIKPSGHCEGHDAWPSSPLNAPSWQGRHDVALTAPRSAL